MYKRQFTLLLASLAAAPTLLMAAPSVAADVLATETVNRLQALPSRLDNFNGNLSWTHFSAGVAGGEILQIEKMPGDQAYAALHEGKQIQELPLATIQWHELTSTSLAQNTKTAWYHSTSSPKLDLTAVREVHNKLSILKDDSTDVASHAPPGFDFMTFKIDEVTTAGTRTQAVLPDGSISESNLSDAATGAFVSKQPSPFHWPINPENWNRILSSTNWTPGSSGRVAASAEISGTVYTIELGPDQFPYMVKEEKVMPGGWTRVIISNFSEWSRAGNIWVPRTISTDVLLQDAARSAPISKQLLVLNPS